LVDAFDIVGCSGEDKVVGVTLDDVMPDGIDHLERPVG
jgi:hypothetical protein